MFAAESRAAGIQDIAQIADVPRGQTVATMAAIEAQRSITRQMLGRRSAKAGLEGRREAYRAVLWS